MSYVLNVGQIKVNKPITEETKVILDEVFGSEICEVGGDLLFFDEYYDKWFDETLQAAVNRVESLGYVLNGEVAFYGDYGDGRIEIRDNRIGVLSVEEAAIVDASDETLIEELKKRGYDVLKKGDMNLTDLFCRFLSAQEDYRELYYIYEDLKEAGATKEELEYVGYEDYIDEEEGKA